MSLGLAKAYVLRFDCVQAPAVFSSFSLGADLILAKREAERKFRASVRSCLNGIAVRPSARSLMSISI
jgi:hypothetical protein